ncbi:CubicO group peptidase, beta-lactamase class C family [Rhizobium sp. RU20A]|nr:CubicO group peptidase, beta-lactamase class C family [Rhizobium sp. RU20A]
MIRKALFGLALLVAALALGVPAWLYLAPPELLRIGDGYAAKIVCSNVFIAGRDPDEVLALDVQAPGHPLLRFVSVAVDREQRSVAAHIFGFAAPAEAVYREGLGCTSLPDGTVAVAPRYSPNYFSGLRPPADKPWPEGTTTAGNAAIQDIIVKPEMQGPGMRAIIVVKDGRIIAETYGKGFTRETPLLGWSMTKTVTAALVGRRIAEGAMTLESRDLLPSWSTDGRSAITLADLMAMQSGLTFNEDYGSVADVTRMLYLESDMAAFTASKPLEHPPGTHFSYSSGTTTLISRLWMDSFESEDEALAYPRRALFRPLGMTSAVLEPDARGTFVGSSYMYATARDWARFALFLLRDGNWQGRPLLPEGFVAYMRKPTEASGGRYGHGQVWTEAAVPDPGAPALPPETFWMRGHDGQSIMISPTLDLAVIRLGLTPSSTGYSPRDMNARIVSALAPPAETQPAETKQAQP